MNPPTEAGPDTVCECGHWFEEHAEGDMDEPWSKDICAGCDAAGHEVDVIVHDFKFDPEQNTFDMIVDRGGSPEKWPAWVKERAARWI